MTVESLLSSMSSAEFAEWLAYYVLEPFGEEWEQTASICAMVGNAAGGKYKRRDFMPVQPPLYAQPQQSSADILAIFKGLAGKVF